VIYLEVTLCVGRAIERGAASNTNKWLVWREDRDRRARSFFFLCSHNFFCWKICFRASEEGDQVPLEFCRQRSLSEARIDTTSWRLRGLSGVATQNELPSPRPASVEAASLRSAAVSGATSLFLSLRTDILVC